MPSAIAPLREAALEYAEHGVPIFPVWGVTDGRCQCAAIECANPGKHPIGELVPHGVKDATTEPELIRWWWTRYPDANIAMATIKASVLDIDPRHGGDMELARLERQHGALPETAEVLTPSGGRHLHFAPVPGLGPSSGKIAPGIDVRSGPGAYVLLPPSTHLTGRRYVDEVCHPLFDTPVAAMPAWLIALARAEATNGQPAASVDDTIPEGQRNDTLASLAGTMRRRGMGTAEIAAALAEVNRRRCQPPLPDTEIQTIAASIGRYAPKSNPAADPGREHRADEKPSPWWARALPVSVFLDETDANVAWLWANVLAPGSLTELFAPRGVGKTHLAYAIAVGLARMGHRVLLLDRDNSRREVRRRLRAWGAASLTTFRVLLRDDVPPLTEAAAWADFPFREWELIIVDSLDATTEGAGEKDSSKPSKAIAPLLDIAHRADGPAILTLGNTIKSGEHSRGSGIVEDRADVAYEVRDATDFHPTGTKDWWLELPPAGAADWGERASRRKRRDTYRLACIPSKFRIGEEPEPFVYEIDLRAEPWQMRLVTAEVVAAGQAAVAEAEREQAERKARGVAGLAELLATQPMPKTDAIDYLRAEHGLSRDGARKLVDEHLGVRWKAIPDPSQRGRPKFLHLVQTPAAAETTSAKSPLSTPDAEGGISAARMDTGPPKCLPSEARINSGDSHDPVSAAEPNLTGPAGAPEQVQSDEEVNL